MLNNLAVAFANADAETQSQISTGVVLLGFIIGLIIFSRERTGLRRGTYLAYCGLTFFGTSALSMLWLASWQALAFGALWLLVGVVFAGIGTGGFFFGKFALARSRDAFGHGRFALLAFLPLLNLILVLKPSLVSPHITQVASTRPFSGSMGVFVGIALILAGVGIGVFVDDQANRMVADAKSHPDAIARMIELTIEAEGIENAVRSMAPGRLADPIIVDQVTRLVAIEPLGKRLRRTFEVSLPTFEMTSRFRNGIRGNICSYGPLITLIRAGGEVEEVYMSPNGTLMGSEVVTQQSCTQ